VADRREGLVEYPGCRGARSADGTGTEILKNQGEPDRTQEVERGTVGIQPRALPQHCAVPVQTESVKRSEDVVRSSRLLAGRIEVLDPDLCPRYCGRVLSNVHVVPSVDVYTRGKFPPIVIISFLSEEYAAAW
jgi:hypothetical protein